MQPGDYASQFSTTPATGPHRVSRYLLKERKSAYELAKTRINFDKAAIQQKKASLRAAEDQLEATNIVSPADGTVISRNVAIGQVVEASEAPALFAIADLTRMKIALDVPQNDAGMIKAGDRANLTVEAFPNRSFDAVVSQVGLAPRTAGNVVTYDVVLDVDNSHLLLKPGMAAAARIVTAGQDDAR